MQKRTNPLALKMDAAAKSGATESKQAPVQPAQEIPAVEVPSVEEYVAPAAEVVAAPVETALPAKEKSADQSEVSVESKPTLTKRRVPVAPVEPEEPVKTPVASEPEVKKEREIEKAAPMMGGAVQWQMVTSKKSEPQVEDKPAMPTWSAPARVETAQPVAEPEPEVEPVADPEPEIENEIAEPLEDEVAEDILGEEEQEATVSQEAAPSQPASKPLSQDAILDEQLPPSIEDYEMAARFGLCGRVSRGMKVGKISRDVCRLAQLMHPNESLSSILEGALLTRIYLENRDAFDALAEMLEKKGGHIKC